MKVAVLGIGLMGRSMTERLLRCDHSLVVYNRTREKAEVLDKLGAKIALDPSEAIAWAECAIVMVTDTKAVRDVLFPETSSRPDLRGRTIIQMGTISPNESISIKDAVEQSGGEYLEAPVLGSTPQAEKGELIVMVGAEREQFARWSSLLNCFSPKPFHIGPVGKAVALKLALNQLIASLTTAFCFSLGIVLRREIDVELFLDILRQSALYAPQFDNKLSLMLNRDFSNPHFSTMHLLKDVQLILAEGRALGLETAALEGIRHLLMKALDKGWAEVDYSSLYNVINPEI